MPELEWEAPHASVFFLQWTKIQLINFQLIILILEENCYSAVIRFQISSSWFGRVFVYSAVDLKHNAGNFRFHNVLTRM